MEAALAQIRGWAGELDLLGERIGPRFGRVEVRRRAAAFLRGLLGGAERKNGWQLPALPAAVEVAAFRIATEAIRNAAKHAHARRCTVRLALDGALGLEVTDTVPAYPPAIGPALA